MPTRSYVMILQLAARGFDALQAFWNRPAVSRKLAVILVSVFLLTGLAILLKRLDCLPAAYAARLPQNPFFAIQLAFSLILITEVVELIFSLPESVSLAVSKQMEIMALLLLRESFIDIGLLNPNLNLETDGFILAQIGMTAVAGLLMFIFRGVFLNLYSVQTCADMSSYVNAKKLICLFLFVSFLGAAAHDLYQVILLGRSSTFFKTFYTFLIFTDILLILVGQYYHSGFQVTFRNSGFAVSTLLMRLALGAPHYLAAALCVCSGLYLIALAWTDARFSRREKTKRRKQELPAR